VTERATSRSGAIGGKVLNTTVLDARFGVKIVSRVRVVGAGRSIYNNTFEIDLMDPLWKEADA
jgi:hypothetical protein